MDHTSFHIRQFTSANVAAYKAIRLQALQSDPGMYGNSYAMEIAMTDEEWLDRVTNPRFARFGLYHGDELIGLTGIIIDKDVPTGAHMTQSYIAKAYRGQKLSRHLYDARIQWAKEHGIQRLLIMHRATNLASKNANRHYGFTYTHTAPDNWPDGVTEDMVYYELLL